MSGISWEISGMVNNKISFSILRLYLKQYTVCSIFFSKAATFNWEYNMIDFWVVL